MITCIACCEGCVTLAFFYDSATNDFLQKMTGKRFRAPPIYDGDQVLDEMWVYHTGPFLVRQGDKFVEKLKYNQDAKLSYDVAHANLMLKLGGIVHITPIFVGLAYLIWYVTVNEMTVPPSFWAAFVLAMFPFHQPLLVNVVVMLPITILLTLRWGAKYEGPMYPTESEEHTTVAVADTVIGAPTI